jgi:ABC-2 type transport system ATP-binding protein
MSHEKPLNSGRSDTGSPFAVRIQGLSKTYKTGFWFLPKVTHALKDLDLEVPTSQAFGLLGLNGAGKTTTIKIMLGLLKPGKGSVEILGGKITQRSIRNRIGYLPELPYFPRQHTGRELLIYFGALHGLAGKALSLRVDEVLELVRMTRSANERLSGYSKGMQQRIGIGQALIGKPEFLICDEPMSGLDPVGYKEMRDIFIDLKHSGTTLFINTHILDEVERICDRVGILHEGHLKDIRDVSQIMESTFPLDYWIDVKAGEAAKLSGYPGQKDVLEHQGLQVKGSDLSGILAMLTSKGVQVGGIRPLSSHLESYFLKTIGMDSSNRPPAGGGRV